MVDFLRIPILEKIRAATNNKQEIEKGLQEEKSRQSPYGQLLQSREDLLKAMTNSATPYIVADDD